MKRIIVLILTMISLIVCLNNIVYADETGDKLQLNVPMDYSNFSPVTVAYMGDITGELPPSPTIFYQDWKRATGTFTYLNADNTRLGIWDLQWVFTPDDPDYLPATGTIKIDVIIPTGGSVSESEDSIPRLVPSSITMEPLTSYDIEIYDKINGSSYTWTSSDKNKVSVNKSTGRIKAKKEGVATIKCKVDTPYDETFTLSIDVKVVPVISKNKDNSLITFTSKQQKTLDQLYDSSKSTCTFKSSDKSVVQIDPYTGVVKAKATGSAYIICSVIDTDYNVNIFQYNVNVTE